jgi:hypothetical protein
MRTLTTLLLAVALALTGIVAAPDFARANQSPTCHQQYIAEPVNETGLSCPGNPAVWQSFTMATEGFGWYTRTTSNYDGSATILMWYQHRSGPLAFRRYYCPIPSGPSCRVVEWNGVSFP